MKAKGPVFLLGRRNLKFWHEAIRGDKELECFAPVAVSYAGVATVFFNAPEASSFSLA